MPMLLGSTILACTLFSMLIGQVALGMESIGGWIEETRGIENWAYYTEATLEELLEMQAGVREIYVDSAISDYIVRLVNATRNHPDVYLGASPRGSLALYRAGQAFAALSGRDFVIPDDIKLLAEPALAHRLIVRTAATIRDVDPRAIVHEILDTVPVEGRPLPPGAVAPLRPGAVGSLPPGVPIAGPPDEGPIPMQGGPRQAL